MVIARIMLILALLTFGYCLVLLSMKSLWVLFFAVFILLAASAKKGYSHYTAHGTARWADQADLERAGMLEAKTGLILGKLTLTPPGVVKAAEALLNPRVPSDAACRDFLMSMRLLGKQKPEGPLV